MKKEVEQKESENKISRHAIASFILGIVAFFLVFFAYFIVDVYSSTLLFLAIFMFWIGRLIGGILILFSIKKLLEIFKYNIARGKLLFIITFVLGILTILMPYYIVIFGLRWPDAPG
ncbi:MAG: hypothetical protein KKA79_07990 [Nanoarchaeota archaeon]|nr:hypothetical protein [Nanoarchaeota archaeon]MCG2718321.1 hypothetical protein [Nanoarchaeota archaeon]